MSLGASKAVYNYARRCPNSHGGKSINSMMSKPHKSQFCIIRIICPYGSAERRSLMWSFYVLMFVWDIQLKNGMIMRIVRKFCTKTSANDTEWLKVIIDVRMVTKNKRNCHYSGSHAYALRPIFLSYDITFYNRHLVWDVDAVLCHPPIFRFIIYRTRSHCLSLCRTPSLWQSS